MRNRTVFDIVDDHTCRLPATFSHATEDGTATSMADNPPKTSLVRAVEVMLTASLWEMRVSSSMWRRCRGMKAKRLRVPHFFPAGARRYRSA